ncbi:MAG: radical SAM protein [Planctomycetota bacterium]|nr:MAG: radical SAM protein [Planctomycetota bacterium]
MRRRRESFPFARPGPSVGVGEHRRVRLPRVENRGILTPTGGYLARGFTHTLNPYLGCSFAGGLCGRFCYAQHNPFVVRGRPWGLYAAKGAVRAPYLAERGRAARPRRGPPRPVRIYMSSSTDPYLPQERELRRTREALEAMLEHPPDALVLQTRSPLALRDLPLLAELAARCRFLLSVTVETDLDPVPGLPPHATPIAARLELLAAFREEGLRTQAAVAPLLPLGDPWAFARRLGEVCERVVLDHYLLGDGSEGRRTARTDFPALLEAAGYGAWCTLEPYGRFAATLREVLGAERVLLGCEGFNTP